MLVGTYNCDTVVINVGVVVKLLLWERELGSGKLIKLFDGKSLPSSVCSG